METRMKLGVMERIRQRVEVGENGCWVWQRSKNKGYGHMSVGGKLQYTHRLAYELLTGPIPKGLELDHLCRNRACCNPEHLEPVTSAVNSRRGDNFHRDKTHCPRGHAYAEYGSVNVRWYTQVDGTAVKGAARRCLACRRESYAASRAKKADMDQCVGGQS